MLTAPGHPTDYASPGLYLVFDDSVRLALTREFIGKTAERFLRSPALIPEEKKRAATYQACSICPERETARICHAILPCLPFIENFEAYRSHDQVTAIYSEGPDTPLNVARTELQQALKYVAILSLMTYCEVGKAYAPLLHGVNPLLPSEEIADVVLDNLHANTGGDLVAMKTIIDKMTHELLVTSRCQIERIRLLSRSDSFANAFVNMQSATSLLLLEIEDRIKTASG